MSKYLTRVESAAYLTDRGFKISASYLEKLATRGGGPQYSIFGNRALYVPEDLDDWAQRRLKTKHSTSDVSGGADAPRAA